MVWNLVQGKLAFQGTHKAFPLLAALSQLFGVEAGDFPHPLPTFLPGAEAETGKPVSNRPANPRRSVVKVSAVVIKTGGFPLVSGSGGSQILVEKKESGHFLSAMCVLSTARLVSL